MPCRIASAAYTTNILGSLAGIVVFGDRLVLRERRPPSGSRVSLCLASACPSLDAPAGRGLAALAAGRFADASWASVGAWAEGHLVAVL